MSSSYSDLVLDKRHKVGKNIPSIANDLLSGLSGPARKNGRCSCSNSEGCVTCGGTRSLNSVGNVNYLLQTAFKVVYLGGDNI
jgi:hypothetical protein